MSVTEDDVKKYADLSRIELSDEEVTTLQGELDAIVHYIDTIQKVPMPEGVSASPHLEIENVMREDGEPHEPGIYTEDMLNQAPEREGKHLKVKKILNND